MATGSFTTVNTMGTETVVCFTAGNAGVPLARITSGASRNKFRSGGPGSLEAVHAPAVVDLQVLTDCPTQFAKALLEGRGASLSLRIVCSRQHERSNPPHPCRLCARRERPCRRRTAERGQQFPPSDGDCHTPLPCEVRKGKGTTP